MPYGVGAGFTGYDAFGTAAIFWSSEEVNKEYTWDWKLTAGWDKIVHYEGHKLANANLALCFKN